MDDGDGRDDDENGTRGARAAEAGARVEKEERGTGGKGDAGSVPSTWNEGKPKAAVLYWCLPRRSSEEEGRTVDAADAGDE
jgi:hypothetical protein